MPLSPEESAASHQWQRWQQSISNKPHDQWTNGDFAVANVTQLMADISNGGWSQILSNPEYLEEILHTLEAIGAYDTRSILQRCISLFPEGKLADTEEERISQMQSFSPQDDETIDRLNQEFYDSREDLCALAISYWKLHCG